MTITLAECIPFLVALFAAAMYLWPLPDYESEEDYPRFI